MSRIHLIVVDDMGFVLLLPGDDGRRLPTDSEHEARADRLVGSYGGAEVWVAPVDGDELPGDWFDPADLPEPLAPLARAAVGDMIRGQYGVVREL
ncbi:MAG TPA: hypothetical protein VFI37_13290 [Gaiellaceae bacterium]|nr:hypothetical protein [Gaiellaceae bacterium]